ncbi:rRNA-processing protein [Wickerhamomyces ciferrii]|uniref:rRNA-processing protein FYV7 n=1 Tax=Wickerhamomyces ciferrii (strain ATCC 14091 / BCRC 22168 / CBS 111 / JCM 3599 / NBRC 0793 / NRRL Y-1031 F-60-10) TaxID=1206466 RepID=K0KIP0_WICCF|nr:rRNA-processing protein [Wickerhamomyces ciferrii]CCH41249.1 rRNA-processing protein [Wickerhamomyces ciferrii]
MAPPYNKNFKSKNPYINRKESKSIEIKKSLVHRARLRKQYFKELKEQGEEVPEKQETSDRNRDRSQYQPKLDYKERAEIAKKRKEEARKERELKRQESIKISEKKKIERERKKDQLSKKTRSGQPLMGPRIANLLDKIKNDQ